MGNKLKYIELFEGYTQDEIPYSEFDNVFGELNIKFPTSTESIPEVFNQLTTEITGNIDIENTQLKIIDGFNNIEKLGGALWLNGNAQLTQVYGFNNLKNIDNNLGIFNNAKLNTITGFDNLDEIYCRLYIHENPKLISLSIPSTLIRSVNYKKHEIEFEKKYEFESPEEFVNSELVIQDCIEKFDPGLHGGVVVKQILENVELWGSENTKKSVYSHIAKNGKPEHIEHLPEMYRYLHHPKHKNTGAKSVAKVATGVTYGLF